MRNEWFRPYLQAYSACLATGCGNYFCNSFGFLRHAYVKTRFRQHSADRGWLPIWQPTVWLTDLSGIPNCLELDSGICHLQLMQMEVKLGAQIQRVAGSSCGLPGHVRKSTQGKEHPWEGDGDGNTYLADS